MSATTETSPPPVPEVHKLRHGALGLMEAIGQSIANISPTLTPAINISVVVAMAGLASWLAFFVGTLGILIVGVSVGILASRHTQAGSFFVYIGRSFGPFTGAIAGWSMISAYLMTALAVVQAVPLFIGNFLTAIGVNHLPIPLWVFGVAATFMIGYGTYRDIKLSSRASLFIEVISVGIIIIIAGMVIGVHGTVVDPQQLAFSKFNYGAVFAGLPLVIFSFVGFESSATLAKESANPKKSIPLAVMGCAIFSGIFFTLIAYLMVFGDGDNVSSLGGSGSPFTDVADKAGLSWTAGIVYAAAAISAFACGMASVNAASRLLFSMGRYQFLHNSMGLVHKSHKTPYAAVLLSTAIVLVGTVLLIPGGFVSAYGWTGTLASFGFVLVYLLLCIAAPIELRKTGELKPWNIALGAIGVALMLFVVYGSVYPMPAYPYNILPYMFLAYVLVGAVWFGILKAKSPQVLTSIVHDMEG
jgi:amino acid transporter